MPPEIASERGRPPAWAVPACLLLLCSIWGSTYLVIRQGLVDLPPFTGAAVRFILAGAVFGALAPVLARREGGAAPGVRLTLAMGVLNVAVPYGIVYWSETVLSSGLVSVLWAIYPMTMAVSGHWFLPGERMRRSQWFGLFAGLAGVASLFATDLAAVGPEAITAGLVVLGSPAIYTVGTTIVKREGRGTSSVLLNRNGMLVGALFLSALALATERPAEVVWTPRAVGSVLYLTLFGTVVTFGLFFWLMRWASATRLSLIAYVIPAVALVLGALVADEPVGWHTFGGLGLILVGVALVHGRWPPGLRSAR